LIKVIKDFKLLESYTRLIKNKLMNDLWELVYKPMFKIVGLKAVNEDNPILAALKSGKIFYENGGFKTNDKFSNRLSQALIKLGARYDRWEHSYKIDMVELPKEVLNAIKQSVEEAQKKLNHIEQFLQYLEYNLDQIIESLVFNDEVGTILGDVNQKVNRNINIVELDLTPEQSENIQRVINKNFTLSKKEIEENYNNSIQKYTKKWLNERLPEIRRKVEKAVLEGYREIDVQRMLEKEYGIAERKAKFLAQNETAIMLAEIKRVSYQAMGFEHFMWQTILDARERPLHHKLHGKVFRFDNPPEIDERTHQRGLPGETYNCRCNLIPVMYDDEFFNQNNNERTEDLKQYSKVMQNV